jgi:hypothetical protein
MLISISVWLITFSGLPTCRAGKAWNEQEATTILALGAKGLLEKLS